MKLIANRTAYSYLLGLYLGDGWLTPHDRPRQLGIACDGRYPGIIDACCKAMATTLPGVHIAIRPDRHSQCVRVISSSRRWAACFPQHGRGRKHTRRIVLEQWQRDIVDECPRELLTGLLHSDGCRVVNRFKVKLPSGRIGEYAYGRYFFSNLSPDIRALFCEYCDLLGVHWTQSNHRNISVSHRRSVAILDEFVPAKD